MHNHEVDQNTIARQVLPLITVEYKGFGDGKSSNLGYSYGYGMITYKGLRFQLRTTRVMAPTTQMTDKQIRIWAIAENEDINANTTDEQIITKRKQQQKEEDEHDDEESENEEASRIKHCDTIKAFAVCIRWAEENQLPIPGIVFKRIEENA
ncbi:hypothetical protein FQA39_LY15240 [Lamprigera yunnana]|nr:hypothetical protein FQA39_LY15240 [Lamprigera yunnana]